MCFVWQPPSNSLFVAVTDNTTLLFCFDSTRHSYYGSRRRPLSKALFRSEFDCSGGLLMSFVWKPPSDSLFVAITDNTTLLFCFHSTRHYCYGTRRRPLSKALFRSTFDCNGGLLMCFIWKPPSNSLFVTITDNTTLLFCFDSTRYSYSGTLRRRRLVVGEYAWITSRVRKSDTLCHCSVT